MEASVADLFSEPEMEDLNFIHHWELSSVDQVFPSQNIWECLEESLSPESYNSCICFESPASPHCIEGPEKLPATAKGRKTPAMAPGILSFGSPGSPGDLQLHSFKNADGELKPMEVLSMELMDGRGLKRAKVARSRPLALNQEHVIAERKRREKITEKLIALSAIVPGVKKRDKASILTYAITYMKEMEEKVKTLEGQAAKEAAKEAVKEAPEPAVSVKMSHLSVDSEESSDVPPSAGGLPDIEARISEKTALIRIHCEDRKGVLVKALTEIEKHHLTVINTSSLPFSDRFLDITVMAQVEDGFSIMVKDLLAKLHSAFREFM